MEDYIKNYELWLKKADEETKAELELISDNDAEIRDRFSVPLSFGTAGMRGVLGAGMFRMNKYTVRRATVGLGKMIDELGDSAKRRGVLIAYDTRRQSFEFALECVKVLTKMEIKTYLYENVRPVPMCSFAVRHLNCIAGIMITASHNPKEYNGYKVYGEDGAQMSPENTAKVVEYIDKADYFNVDVKRLDTEDRAKIQGKDHFWLNDYALVVGKTVDEAYFKTIENLRLSTDAVKKVANELKIVYTPIHGSGMMPIDTVLSDMQIPFYVVEEQRLPDEDFSTVDMPNPENKEALNLGIELANKIKADIVIGTDPDCDRMGVAIRKPSEEFYLLSGNQISALLMDYILLRHKEKGTLPANSAVVKTIVTTGLLDEIAKEYNTAIYSVLTGFKFIGEKIKEWEQNGKHTFMFGCEESYGYLSGTHARDKDAVVATMLFSEMSCYYKSIGKSVYERLEEIWTKHGCFYEANISKAFKGAFAMAEMTSIMAKLRMQNPTAFAGLAVAEKQDFLFGYDGMKADVLKFVLEDGSWIAIRPSGTEPKLKVYVSCKADSLKNAEKLNEKIHAEVAKMFE